MSIKYLDAKRLRRILIGGANWLKSHEEYLNELNVYPVPDGDTGTNMSMTVSKMVDDIQNLTDKKTSMQDLTDVVEESILLGARGNSGTILSQVITGFLKGLENKKRILPEDINRALQTSKEQAYLAVEVPVEGTILTVIRRIAEKSQEIYNTTDNLDEIIDQLVIVAKEAVNSTPDLLPKLKEANVVDSGAMGLFYFFEGIKKTISDINLLTTFNKEEREFNKQLSTFTHNPEDIKFQYCTEFIISNIKNMDDIDVLKQEILEKGDSAVFAKTKKKFKSHVHTNNPGDILEIALKHGELEKVKIENMKIQSEEARNKENINSSNIFTNPEKNTTGIYYIAVADTEELKNKFMQLGADVVILGGQSKNPSTQDFIIAIDKLPENSNIVILPNNKNIVLTAKMAVDKLEQENIKVYDTKTMLQGYYYLYNKDESYEELQKSFANNYSIEITRSIKTISINSININKDDYMAIVNGKIEIANAEISDLFDEIKRRYISNDTINITVVEGLNKSESIDVRIDNLKSEIYGFVDVISTTQEIYNYYILIENVDPHLPEFAVVTDSASDLTNEDVKGYPVMVVPMQIQIDNQSYLDNIDITKEEVWKTIVDNKDCKTAQPSPKAFINIYNKLIRKGYKKIISIQLSKEISGTYQVAKLAAKSTKKPEIIEVVDSKGLGFYIGVLVLEVAKKIMEKEEYDKIMQYISKFIDNAKAYIYVDNLDRLEKGGRISKSQNSISKILNLKPIITYVNGRLQVIKKTIGEKRAISFIENEIYKESKKHSLYLFAGYGGRDKERIYLEDCLHEIKRNNKVTLRKIDFNVGAIIGAHTGPVYGILVIPRLM